ncbi:hypothetical protein K502DRAFT_112767 [Neoconidiobolus thromboides FSU 785]|nr:hypothetical protein K502DRAFT_112767 [Neoconidiobolus thromboides FSU 785]
MSDPSIKKENLELNLHPQYDQEEVQIINEKLARQLEPTEISHRTAFGGSRVAYLEGWKSIEIANEIFGFNGWSSEIKDFVVDFLDVADGKWSVGVTAHIRVVTRDGSFHEDVGYGTMENAKSKGQAFEKARKEAVTDGVKRALRYFGNALGNCLYDKKFLASAKKPPTIINNPANSFNPSLGNVFQAKL